MKQLLLFLIPIVMLAACSDSLLDPKPTGDLKEDELWIHAAYGEGLLGRAYLNLNNDYGISFDYYTDNAVPRTRGQNDLALGNWTVEDSPFLEWTTSYNSIRYLNQFLENAYDLTYEVGNTEQDSLVRSHRIGEAYFLRAWYQWQLLQTYGGYAEGDSEAKGVPIVTSIISEEEAMNSTRASYEDNIAQITADIDSAVTRLPLKYDGSGGSPEFYGLANRGRGSKLAALALKARAYLYAASPAYGDANQQLWERAAQAAYDAIDADGGLRSLSSYGNFNDFSNFDYIWIQPTFSSNALEQTYYPPSLFGNGDANPSQNLVDAFPAGNGYPIDHQNAQFNEDNPYENRDPRFERFIFFNGDEYNGTTVETFEGGNDAPGGFTQRGTRTGYYLKKHLSYNVRLASGNQTTDIKFKVFLGKTELYLNFAEAANEAFGPNGGPFGITAADVMRVIRERAGIDSDNSTPGYQDQYLEDQANADKTAFREFIRNERRIELSFEGHRFWDIRRWNEPLNHTVRGVKIAASEGQGEQKNVALESDPSSDYVSQWASIDPVNDGYEPQNSQDNSQGAYHNWDSEGEWRYVQYEFPTYMSSGGTSRIHLVDQSDIYWYAPDPGVQAPDSTYIAYWDVDAEAWAEVSNAAGYGTAEDQWNTTTFDQVATDKIRVYMKNNNASTGVIEWQVQGAAANPLAFTYEYRGVEDHTFQEYMRYVPLPYNETLIMNNLKQNAGW